MNGTDGIRVTCLDNGLRVVSDPMSTVETVSVGVWVEVGTRHEHPRINGVSHLLEHMAFKGTARRDARAIAEEIEAVGGHLNAYTAREHTAYFAKVLKEDTGLAVDIIGDILQNARLDPEELERERAVIIQEIHQAHDTPDDIIFDFFQETAYPDQSLGRPVLGSAELVRDMSRDTIIAYLRENYCASRMILSAAGNIEHDTLVELAGNAFDGLACEGTMVDDPARYVGGDFREHRDLEQVHLLLGFDGVPFRDPDFYALSIFSTLFGGGMSSRLFQEVREKRGLVYSVYSFPSCYVDGGLFGIYTNTGEDEVAELVPLVCEEIGKARNEIGDDEVARARAQLKASILMSLESTSARCEQLARQMMVFGRPIPVAEVVANIEAVDADAVRRTARRVTAGRPVIAALGPIDHLESFDAISRRLI